MENYEDRKTRSANLRLLFEALVVGLVSGVVVGSFRWLIGETLTYWRDPDLLEKALPASQPKSPIFCPHRWAAARQHPDCGLLSQAAASRGRVWYSRS